eukprot:2791581-Pyramimonas_sp.AAC.1
MLISASAASGSMLTVGRALGLEGVWQSLGVLQVYTPATHTVVCTLAVTGTEGRHPLGENKLRNMITPVSHTVGSRYRYIPLPLTPLAHGAGIYPCPSHHWLTLGVLQGARVVTLGARYWLLEGSPLNLPLSDDDRNPEE